jgi:hypothetical protein
VLDPRNLTPNDAHRLELVAVPSGNGHYRLDSQRILSAVEGGNDWAYLTDFLTGRHQGALPAEVLAWLEKLQQNSRAFKKDQPALFIKAKTADLAALVMADPVLQKFCHQLDQKTLVIPANKQSIFRSRLKELEYILS